MQPYINPNYFNFGNYGGFNQQPYNLPPAANNGLNGAPAQPQTASRIVNDFNEVTVGDIPTNGQPGFFIKADGSEIQSRRWSEDGRIVTCRYMPEVTGEPQQTPVDRILQRIDALEAALTPKSRKKEATADE